jgi:hypothetical protein
MASQDKPYKMPRDFDGIEEVADNLERSNNPTIDGGTIRLDEIEEADDNNIPKLNNAINGGEVTVGDIAEVEITSSKKTDVINGGTISSWESSEASHKTKMRQVITATTLALWAIWTIIGLIIFSHTGNTFLIITSPTTVAGVPLYRILYKIIAFYF